MVGAGLKPAPTCFVREGMEDKLLQQFRRLISRKTGLWVRTEDLAALEKIIVARIRLLKLSEPEDYLRLMSADTYETKCEWKELMIPLTIGESFFFRDKGQFAILKDKVFPELIEKRKDVRSLRIWSAGCSSGEEPYSLAILLDGLLADRRDWNISIVGTDINEDALEKARLGAYTQWSFRSAEPEIQGRYFKRRKDGWEIDERIRNMVMFSYGNLIDDLFPGHEICNMDLILCRNVFIYFNSEAISVVAEKFVNTLNEGGYLMTGHGELHLHSYPGLKAKIFPESVVYQKSSEPAIAEFSVLIHPIPSPTLYPSGHKPLKGREYSPLHQGEGQGLEEVLGPGGCAGGVQSAIEKSAIELAQEYADRGEYKKAEEGCKRALETEPYSARCYYLLSQVSEAQGMGDEATEFLKKAIYLDSSFVAAYIELGYTYDRQGDAARAKKMRETAGGLLEKLPKDAVVEPYKDIKAGELLEYVRKMVE